MSSAEEEYIVERILDAKGEGKSRRYLVKWEGYDNEEDNTWEPAKHLHKKLIAEYETQRRSSSSKGSESKNEEREEESEEDDSENDADDEYVEDAKPKKTPAGGKAKADAAKAAVPAAASAKPAKRTQHVTPKTAGTKRPAADSVLELAPSADNICLALSTLDAPSLKAFAAGLSKEGFALKAVGKKEEVLEDLVAVVRATYAGLCVVAKPKYDNYVFSLKADAAPAAFGTERLRSCARDELSNPWCHRFNCIAAEARVEKLEAAWARCSSGAASKRQRASLGSDGKLLTSKLEVLDKKQLVDVLIGLVADGALTAEQVGDKIPTADLQPILDECQKLVNAIRRHLPNSRWGSCTDNYGYKRCAAANNAAARAFKNAAAGFKRSAQWATASAFCEKALPIAHEMVEWDHPSNNTTRNSVIEALTKLKQEAASKTVLVD